MLIMALLHIPCPVPVSNTSFKNVLVKNHPSECLCQFLERGVSEIFQFLSAVSMLGHGILTAASPRIDLVQQGQICFADCSLGQVPLKVSGPVQDKQRFLPTQKFP